MWALCGKILPFGLRLILPCKLGGLGRLQKGRAAFLGRNTVSVFCVLSIREQPLTAKLGRLGGC